MSYNYDSTGACAKHQVSLVYDGDASSPLSLTMLGSTPLVRMHKLLAVDRVCAGELPTIRRSPVRAPMKVAAHL